MAEEPQNDDQSGVTSQPGVVIMPASASPPAPPVVQSTPPESESSVPAEDPSQRDAIEISGAVSWTAPEFMAHDKSVSWYFGLTATAAIFAFFTYLISKDIISAAVVIVAAIVFGFYAAYKPRQSTYGLHEGGISINDKAYSYDDFKSFSIKPEGSHMNLTFMPLKRFATPLTIYYSPPDEEKIMKVLAARMPYEEPRRDATDSLMKRIRF
jgi:hypothetical protein